jgi:Spy/CpxP family protein refolding chaperone
MTSSLTSSTLSASRGSRAKVSRFLSVLIPALALAASALAQTDMPPPPPGADAGQNGGGGNRKQRGNGGNFDPAQMIARLKDTFGVTDDAEWTVISQRLTAVMDLRRTTQGGGFPMRGGNNADRGNRPGRTQNPELEALRSAIRENMPDAEIKARLDRYREVKKENEAKLVKAQEDLKAVLTVKQEAIAAMMGMIP